MFVVEQAVMKHNILKLLCPRRSLWEQKLKWTEKHNTDMRHRYTSGEDSADTGHIYTVGENLFTDWVRM